MNFFRMQNFVLHLELRARGLLHETQQAVFQALLQIEQTAEQSFQTEPKAG